MATENATSMALQRELDVGSKVSNLEKKAGQLEKDFNDMLLAAREMELAVKRYVKRAEAEQKSWEILEKITESDTNISDVFDHIKMFFNFVLAKMKLNQAEVTDVKILWHLLDCEGVSQCFNKVITNCGFTKNEYENLRILLSVVSKMQEELEQKHNAVANVDEIVCKTDGQLVTYDAQRKHERNGIDKPKAINVMNVDGSAITVTLLKINDVLEEDPVTDIKLNVMNECKDELIKPRQIKNIKEQGLPIRDALKNVKFLDIDDDMKHLIRKVVCYVTKIVYE